MSKYPDDARAWIAYVKAVREAVDQGLHLALNVTTSHAPGELIRDARMLRYKAITPVDMAVILELIEGTPWEDVAAALNLPVAETQERYGEALEAWRTSEGIPDEQVALEADLLDQWVVRHSDPWDIPVEQPVTRALTV